ncbi:MAG: DUF2029 domain-containing protein [Rubrobacter sp.]|nr:DUF2029 domain-containing protein [Rubrobacter sp.]
MTRRTVPLYVAALLAALGLLAGLAGTAAAEQPTLSEPEAVKLAEADDEVRDELGDHEGYTTEAEHEDGEWTVSFWTGSGEAREEVARAGIDDESWRVEYAYTGPQVEWQMARGETGAYGKQANYWYVWGPLVLAFALAFVRTDRLFSLRNLDVAALLGFLVSHGFFREGIVEEAVILWYPPLLYLFVRTLLMGFGIGERVERTSNLPTWLLLALAALAGGLVLFLNLDSRVIDVGYAGVAGGDRILDGIIPYGNMPEDVGTGDTYGPLNYLLYVPFILMFGFSGEWDYLPAAHALTVFAFAGGAIAMFFAGFRLSGVRVGAAMLFAWAVFPYTLYSANNNTNDIVVAAVAAAGLALISSPIGRGVAVAAGFAIKLYPLLLAPLWMLHGGLRRRSIVDFVLGGLAVLIASFWVLALGVSPVEGARLFYESTLSFQGDRETPWTIYAQVPELSFLQRPLTVAVLVLAVLVAFLPRKRTVRRLAALSAAVVIGFQLTVNYWFYPYITWFEPFVFLALLPATGEKSPLDRGSGDQTPADHEEPRGLST